MRSLCVLLSLSLAVVLLLSSSCGARAQFLTDLQPSTTTDLDPFFDPSVQTYTLLVPFLTSSVSFVPQLNGSAALSASWDDQPPQRWDSNTTSPPFNMDGAAHILTLTVERPNLSNLTYVINVARISVVGRNANLISARFHPTAWMRAAGFSWDSMIARQQPAVFSSQVYEYQVDFWPNVTAFEFSGWVDATARLNVTIVQAGQAERTAYLRNGFARSPTVMLQAGETVQFFANVTAEDEATKKNYVFYVTRLASMPDGGDGGAGGDGGDGGEGSTGGGDGGNGGGDGSQSSTGADSPSDASSSTGLDEGNGGSNNGGEGGPGADKGSAAAITRQQAGWTLLFGALALALTRVA